MTNLIDYLESFNRKERFFLIGQALGNPLFQLSEDFRVALSKAFGFQVPVDAFVAMDYHLDWIHTSLFLTLPGNGQQAIHPNTGPVATGNQEDVDLIVGFDDGHVTQLLLIEAKGETSWTNKQTLSKANRLRDIFGKDGMKYEGARPHFGLISPRPPRQLKSHLWPSWMTQGGEPIWIELAVPTGRQKVTRCDSEGRPRAAGGFFKVIRTDSRRPNNFSSVMGSQATTHT